MAGAAHEARGGGGVISLPQFGPTGRPRRSRVTPPEDGALAPHFRLLELGGSNRSVESGAQLLGCLQRQLNPSPRPGFEGNVDEVERDDLGQRRMTRLMVAHTSLLRSASMN
jgi:hypothetical protein